MSSPTLSTPALRSGETANLYLPLAQNYESRVALHVRAASNPTLLVPAIRDVVRQVDRQIAVESPQLLSDVLDRTLAGQRLTATFVGLFGAIA